MANRNVYYDFFENNRVKLIFAKPYAVGLFEEENSVEQQMFELAIQKVNIDPNFSNVFLKAKIEIVDSSDTYKTGLKGTQYKYYITLYAEIHR